MNDRLQPSLKPRLLDRVREALCLRHYSPRTEQAYVHSIRRYVFFHQLRHPSDMDQQDVKRFLSHLAIDEKLSASTQNQAPVVLTHEEVAPLLSCLDGIVSLVCNLLYGSGLRLLECLQMRMKDIDLHAPPRGPRKGPGPGAAARGPGPQARERRLRVVLAIRLPGVVPLPIAAPASGIGITSTRPWFRKPWPRPSAARASTNLPRLTPCATLSRPS